MPNEPKFRRLQTVMLSLYNHEGKPKTDLAAKFMQYNAHYGEVVSWKMSQGVGVMYKVEMEDRKIIELTEDCLIEIKGPVSEARHRHH